MGFFTQAIKDDIISQINSELPTNGNREIDASEHRALLINIIDQIDTSYVDVSSVVTLAVVGDSAYNISENTLLSNFVIIPSVSGPIKIGLSAGGSEIYEMDGILGEVEVLSLQVFRDSADIMYLTGNFTIKFKAENYA